MEQDLVVVRSYLNHFTADVARTALEAAGIDTMIRSDDCGGLRPHLWLGGIQLLVRAEDRHRANEVLNEHAIVEGDGPPMDA
ncbi:MAG TPA: DUF2007 domain-containing protein [Vicinamibacterales bacterium]|jgi:hypothetical protein|nr:DUF2007 domain-containing protein [Vicinamibacterales bacterium]